MSSKQEYFVWRQHGNEEAVKIGVFENKDLAKMFLNKNKMEGYELYITAKNEEVVDPKDWQPYI